MTRGILLAVGALSEDGGSVSRFHRLLCLALDELSPELRLEVRVLAPGDRSAVAQWASEPWHHLELVSGERGFDLARKTVAAAIARRPDLLLLGSIGMSPLGLACLPFLKRGFGFVAHGVECWRGHSAGERRRFRIVSARRAEFVLATSRFTGRAVCDLTDLPAKSIWLLPESVRPERGDGRRSGYGSPAEPYTELLSVADLGLSDEGDGVEQTIRAFAELAAAHPRTRYRIVGGGERKQRWERLAGSLGIAHRMVFESTLSDGELAQRYRRCALFVLPAAQDGPAAVFLEAMRFAKPCVGGNQGGTPELIVDGETGCLVPPGSVPILKNVLGRLLAAPELRSQLGQAGHRRLQEQFSFERFRDRLAGYLREALRLT